MGLFAFCRPPDGRDRAELPNRSSFEGLLIQAIDFRLVSFRFSVLVLLDFSMNPFLKVPIRYWFISCMGALWFAMGALDYVMISYKIPAYMQTMPEDLHHWFDQRPVWFTGVWAINVWSALLGSFLLLMRRRQAMRLFVLALVGFIVAALWTYLSEAANMAHMQSTIIHIFNGLILFSLVYFLFFCRRYIQTGVLR